MFISQLKEETVNFNTSILQDSPGRKRRAIPLRMGLDFLKRFVMESVPVMQWEAQQADNDKVGKIKNNQIPSLSLQLQVLVF